MTVEDLENRFADWGNPEAHVPDAETEEILEGGHGNGGKCYMTQMFGHSSFLHTVSGGRGSTCGFIGDDPHPGYFPEKRSRRGFPVSKPAGEIRRVLNDLSIDFAKLPEEVRTAATARNGFTLPARSAQQGRNLCLKGSFIFEDEEAHGEYRTKRVILEIYDALLGAARSGEPYQTFLDLPSADPRVAHASPESRSERSAR